MAEPNLGRRERKKLATRDALRRAGFELFRQKGYGATSLLDITDAADVGRSTFYRHFETKEDLLLVEVRQRIADVEEALDRCPESLSPMECHFRVTDEVESQWADAPPPPGGVSFRQLYALGQEEPAVVARFYWLVNQHVIRVKRRFAQRLGLGEDDMQAHLFALLSGMALTTELAYAFWLSDTEQEEERTIRERVLVQFSRGLDPEAAERRVNG